MGVTALIPIVGAFIGTIVGAVMILTVNPFKAVLFVIFLLILQQVEGGRLCCPLTPEGYTALQNSTYTCSFLKILSSLLQA